MATIYSQEKPENLKKLRRLVSLLDRATEAVEACISLGDQPHDSIPIDVDAIISASSYLAQIDLGADGQQLLQRSKYFFEHAAVIFAIRDYKKGANKSVHQACLEAGAECVIPCLDTSEQLENELTARWLSLGREALKLQHLLRDLRSHLIHELSEDVVHPSYQDRRLESTGQDPDKLDRQLPGPTVKGLGSEVAAAQTAKECALSAADDGTTAPQPNRLASKPVRHEGRMNKLESHILGCITVLTAESRLSHLHGFPVHFSRQIVPEFLLWIENWYWVRNRPGSLAFIKYTPCIDCLLRLRYVEAVEMKLELPAGLLKYEPARGGTWTVETVPFSELVKLSEVIPSAVKEKPIRESLVLLASPGQDCERLRKVIGYMTSTLPDGSQEVSFGPTYTCNEGIVADAQVHRHFTLTEEGWANSPITPDDFTFTLDPPNRQRDGKSPVWERLDLRPSADGSDHTAVLDGKRLPIRGEAPLKMLKVLQEKKGERVKGILLQNHIGQPPNRVYALLAEPLQRIIDRPGQGGTGYAMREDSCPIPLAKRKSDTRRKKTAKPSRKARTRGCQR